MNAQEFANHLLAVRDGAPLLDHIPSQLQPKDSAQAYEVADLIVVALEVRLGAVMGYKVGATSTAGQKVLGLKEPFYGCIFGPCILASSAVWRLGGRACTVEAEIGIVMRQHLPARSQAYEMTEVRAAIHMVVPLLEINRPSYAKPFEVGGLGLIADNGVTQGFVLGSPGLELNATADLPGETVNMLRNDMLIATGTGHAVLGNPLNAVLWLANALRVRGKGLRAGDVIASGAMVPHMPLVPGDLIRATYSTVGEVCLSIGG